MIETKQEIKTSEDTLTRAGFWGSILLHGILLVIYAYSFTPIFQAEKTLIVYIAMVVLLLALVATITGLFLTVRHHQGSGITITFWALLFMTTALTVLYQGRAVSFTISILVISVVGYGWLFPRPSRSWLLIPAGVTLALIWLFEWLQPAWRQPSNVAQIGPLAAAAFVLIFGFFLVRQAWGGNIRIKLVTSFAVIALISVAVVGTVVYVSYRNQIREDIRQRLLDITSIIALQQNGDQHAMLQNPEDMQSEIYKQMVASYDAILGTDSDLEYIYTMRMNNAGQIYFVLDSSLDETYTEVTIGEIYDDASDLLVENFTSLDQPIVEEDFYTDKFGTFLSAYAPIYHTDGTREGILAVDILADNIIAHERSILILILGTTLATMLVVTLIGLWLGNLFVGPVINLSNVANKITEGDLNARAEIETADEVGDLAKVFNAMTSRLQGTLQNLEQRVAERTRNLELAAEVGRAVSQVRELDIMLKEAAEIIRTRFDLYYTQVYLLTPNQTELVLEAGTGTVGAELLEKSHRLPANTASINGRAVIEKRPVIIADTTTSATFRPNPLLPETRSEMAVPLMIGEQVVGVLDLQSSEPDTLNQEILPAFEALAGQLAVAIQNANLLAETEQARAEVEAQARRLVRTGWNEYLDAIHKPEQTGFLYEGDTILPLENAAESQPTTEASGIAAPIAVTGEPIGSLVVELAEENQTPQNLELVETVARQVAQQLENLRLLDSAERYRSEAEQAARRLTREGWQSYVGSTGREKAGYLYDLNNVISVEGGPQTGENAITLPLKVRDEAIGKLAVMGVEKQDDEALGLATAVADRLGAHIESLRQYGETQSALEQSEKLFEASRVLTQSQNLQELTASTATMLAIPEINRAILTTFNYDQQGNIDSLDIVANWWNGTGMEASPVGTRYTIEMLAPLSFFVSPTPVFFNDTNKETDSRLDDTTLQLAERLKLRAVAVLPLFTGPQQIGALILEAEEPHNFTPKETRLFSALAPQIATVLENRRQFERAHKQAERESMLNIISQKIQSATSVDAVLQIAARELGHALGAPLTVAQLKVKDQ